MPTIKYRVTLTDDEVAMLGATPPQAGTPARFYKAVSDAHLANIIKVDLSALV